MWRGPQIQGVPVRWPCIKALCPTPDASRKSQGILVLVLEEGHGGQAGTTLPIFQTGKQAQRGKGTHPRSDSPTSSWRRWAGLWGWVNIRTFPTMGSSTEPQVSAPQCTRPDKKSAMRAPATVDKRSMSRGGGGGAVDKRDTPAHSPPQIRKSLACLLARSFTHLLGQKVSLLYSGHFVPCEWSLRNNIPGLSLSLYLFFPREMWGLICLVSLARVNRARSDQPNLSLLGANCPFLSDPQKPHVGKPTLPQCCW